MHWRDWLPSGLFFAVLAAVQLMWAIAVWSRPRAWLFAVGIAANVGAAALWVASCVVGPPVGPSAGQPEAVGAAGIAVLLLQCYVVLGAGWAWARNYESAEVSGFGRAIVLVGANSIMAGAVAVGLVASFQGHHEHGGVAEAEAESGYHGVHEATTGGHQHGGAGHSDPIVPQLPVTDMSLDTADDNHHAQHGATPGSAVPQQPSPIVPALPESVASDTDSGDDGNHDGHHG